MSHAYIKNYNGAPTIMIDGKPYPPMTMTTDIKDKKYLKKLGESGIKIYYIMANTRWNQPGDPNFELKQPKWAWFLTPDLRTDGISQTVEDINTLLEAVPDAYIFLRLNVAPPCDWVNDNPQEQVRYSDGSTYPVICTTVSRFDTLDGMHSLCSEKWRQMASDAVDEYFREIEKFDCFDRVIGFFLCAGGTSEWYYPLELIKENGAYGDFSEPFKREYTKYLTAKYKSDENLKKVWKRNDAELENPIIPTKEERVYINDIDDRILHTLNVWEREVRGAKIDHATSSENNIGLFLNANKNQHVADFYQAWCESTANTIIYFAEILKKRYPDLLVGSFYGALGCTEYYDASTSTATLKVLDSGYVDFLAAPGVYNNREPGGHIAQREMQDSFRLRNRIFISEADIRTHLSNPWMPREAAEVYNIKDSLTVLKREFASVLCDDINAWWFDMGGDWYNDEDILSLFKRQQEVANYAYTLNRKKHNDIAVIYDCESIHYVSLQLTRLVADYFRTSDLGCIGTSVDYYFHNDMAREDMPDYKFYIMTNVYSITDAEREAIQRKARKNHAVLLWLYAPGYINQSSDIPMQIENIEKTVGMKIGMDASTYFPYFKINEKAKNMLNGLSTDKKYGYIDKNIHSNIWIQQTVLKTPYVNPRFYIDDDSATTLGSYLSDGRTSLAMREADGYTNIYCCTPVVQSDMLREIARYAGCHIYSDSGDFVYANESFVAIHASSDGIKTLEFKTSCSPYEVYEKNYYGNNCNSITFEMKKGETKMWSLKGEI